MKSNIVFTEKRSKDHNNFNLNKDNFKNPNFLFSSQPSEYEFLITWQGKMD
jgi:hypothetical protein